MIIAKKRKLINGGIVVTPPSPNTVTITATLSAPDNSATAVFADLKYNKQAVVNFEWDDNSLGGVVAQGIMATRYFTDGAGNNKPYTGAIGVIGINTFDNSEWGASQAGRVSYTQMKQLVGNGWDIANHSLKHISLADTATAVTDLTTMNNLIQQYTDYKMNYLIVPEDFSFYVQAADQLGFISASTQGPKDNYDIYWQYANNLTNVTSILPTGYTQFNRDFSDDWGATLVDYKSKIDYLVNNSSTSVHRFWRNGSHNLNNSTAFTQLVDYIQAQSGDKLWVCSTREWMEYKIAKQQVVKTQSIVGNVVTITLDYSNIGSSIRWQDLSLILNTTSSITNVTVTGATGSFNPTTKLINIFKQKTTFENIITGQMPLTINDAYFTTSVNKDLTGMLDNSVVTDNFLGYTTDDLISTVEWRYMFYDYNAKISYVEIKTPPFYGDNNMDTPVLFFLKYTNGTETQIGSMTWDFNSNSQTVQYTNPAPALQVDYLITRGKNWMPNKLKVYGSYSAPVRITYARVQRPFKRATGNNSWWYDIVDAGTPDVVNETKWGGSSIFKNALRDYVDWEWLEHVQGENTFSPTWQGVGTDTIYQRVKTDGGLIWPCVKTQPDWMKNTYPDAKKEMENVPVVWAGSDAATIASFSVKESYLPYGKMMYQLIARYGNVAVPYSSLTLYQHAQPDTFWYRSNANASGLNLINYVEVENERDKTWKGRLAYQTCEEFALMMSVAYDGHKNTMGAGVGAKNADPNIKVVMGGVALANPQYMLGMVDWCRKNRGYNNDGSINVCWDVINFHFYANDGGGQYVNQTTRGIAPELSTMVSTIQGFKSISNKMGGKEVWITEVGYDYLSNSSQKAPAIGAKPANIVHADWILRTALLAHEAGIDLMAFYSMVDAGGEDFNTQYYRSGALEGDGTPREAARFVKQANDLIGDYLFSAKLSSSPLIRKYTKSGSGDIYVCNMPTETNATGTYNIPFTAGTSITLYTLSTGSTTPTTQNITTTGTFYTVAVSETPVFIKVN